MSELGKCPTCGGQVSTSAESCPHCGERNFTMNSFGNQGKEFLCDSCGGSGGRNRSCTFCGGSGKILAYNWSTDLRTGKTVPIGQTTPVGSVTKMKQPPPQGKRGTRCWLGRGTGP